MFDAIDSDRNGLIEYREMRRLIRKMQEGKGVGHSTLTKSQIKRILAEADQEGMGYITFRHFKRIIADQRQSSILIKESETLEAFVALGGHDDGEGYIDAQELIRIVKEEFEMTIDIEQIIKDLDHDGTGQINYDEFRSLLDT